MKKGRPSDNELQLRIFDATLALLKEQGYRHISIDGIATLANSSRQTIYRNYQTLDKLIAQATLHYYRDDKVEAGVDEDCYQAILKHLNGTVKILTQTPLGEVFRAVIPDAASNPEFAEIANNVGHKRRVALRALLRQAKVQTIISEATNIEILIDGLMGAIYFRFLLTRRSLDKRYIKQLFDGLISR